MVKRKSTANQRYAAVCVNLISLAFGTVAGWASPSFLLLQSNESPLESGPLSDDEASWIGSMMCLGGILGNFLFGWIADRFGRKISMLSILLPTVISWILVIVGTNVTYLLISRLLGGMVGGGAYVVIPLYITEISEPKVRGTLGSFLVCSVLIGIELSFILGWAVSYYVLPYLLLIIPVTFFCLFVFLPETPQQLLKANKLHEAEKALRYFRNLRRISQDLPDHFLIELEKLKSDFLQEKYHEKSKQIEERISVSWNDFKSKAAIKSALIGILMIFMNQFSGCFTMLNYAATIFAKSGTSVSPNASAAIVGVVQVLGALCSTLLIERLGRKALLLISSVGAALGLFSLGSFVTFENLGYNVELFRWIPIISFAEYLFVCSLGILTVPFIVMAEITPHKVRSVIVVAATSLSWLIPFVLIKFLPLMIEVIGLNGTMFFFGSCTIFGALMAAMMVPETKGKTYDEIMELLN